jgi:hypothetical protein
MPDLSMAGLKGKSNTGIEFPEISGTSRALARNDPGKSQTGQVILEPAQRKVLR